MIPYIKNPFSRSLTCHVCGTANTERFVLEAPPRVADSPEPICGPCYRAQAVAQGWKLPQEPDITAYIECQLKELGLGAEERKAEMRFVPPSLRAAVPIDVLRALNGGAFPREQCFGIGGPFNIGKTSMEVSLIKAMLTQNAMARAPFGLLGPLNGLSLMWVNWVTTVARWRLNGLDSSIGNEVARASKVRFLVLDDLGREPVRPGASEGYLDAILTARDREGLLTLWTTNLEEEALYARYGAGMIRRLTRLNPLAWVSPSPT